MSPDSPRVCTFAAAVVAVTLALGLAGSVAVADNTHAPTASERRRIVGILDVRGPAADITDSFEHALEQQVDTKQYWLVTRRSMHDRLASSTSWTDGCMVGECMREARVQTGAELVVLAALTGSATSFGFVVTIVRTDSGNVVAQESQRCDVCTVDEAMNEAILATIRLLVALPDELPALDQAAPAARVSADRTAQTTRARSLTTRRHTRRTGLGLAVGGLVALAAGTAVYFLVGDRPDAALGGAGAGLGLAIAGGVVLAF